MAESVYFGGRGGGGVDGAPGANGTDGTAFNFRLDFSSTGSYAAKDTVHNSGSIYVCIAANIGSGVLNTNFWNLFARSGSPGAVGLVGLTGATGGSGVPGASGQPGASGAAGLSGTPQILTHLSDTSVASPTVGHLLKYSAGLAWGGAADILSSGGGGEILTFPEVNPTGLQANEVLVYDSGFAMWKPKFTSFPVWDVRDFGASGDGVTNDLLAVLAARTALNNSGGTLYFPGGFYVCKINASNTGLLLNSALLGITRNRTQIIADNDAHIQLFGDISLSGAGIAPGQIAMFRVASFGRVKGGTYSFATTGINVLYSGDGYNGYPMYRNTSTLYGNSFEDCLMSGFAGGSLHGGITNDDGEQLEGTYWKNCTFTEWGGAHHDNLIYHQGRVTFDGCKFIQRSIFVPTGVSPDGNTSVKNHSHATYCGSNRPYSTYKNCLFQNIGGGVGNRANVIQFYGSTPTFESYGLIIDSCQGINTTKGILFDGNQLRAIVCNFVGGWNYYNSQYNTLWSTYLGGGFLAKSSIYNCNTSVSITSMSDNVFDNMLDSELSLTSSSYRNITITNVSSRGGRSQNGRDLVGVAASSYSNLSIYGGKNILVANCQFEHDSSRWLALIRSTYNLNGYAFIDNYYKSDAAGGTVPLQWENSMSRHPTIIGCNFYNDSTNPLMITFSNMASGVILLGNKFYTPALTTAAVANNMLAASSLSSILMKNNTYVNVRKSPIIQCHYIDIGNFYYSGGVGGTGIALLSVYNMSGTM